MGWPQVLRGTPCQFLKPLSHQYKRTKQYSLLGFSGLELILALPGSRRCLCTWNRFWMEPFDSRRSALLRNHLRESSTSRFSPPHSLIAVRGLIHINLCLTTSITHERKRPRVLYGSPRARMRDSPGVREQVCVWERVLYGSPPLQRQTRIVLQARGRLPRAHHAL